MSAASRACRLACHGAVIAWGAALLVGSALEAPPPELPAEAPVARIRPLPEPPPTVPEPPQVAAAEKPPPKPAPVKPEPAPPKQAAPEPAAATTPVLAADLSRGAALLNAGGDFPVLSCSYESFPSFRAYARAMTGLGARFVAVRRRAILGSVDLGLNPTFFIGRLPAD